MSERSYCVLRADDFLDERYRDLAISRLAQAQTRHFSLEEPQILAWRRELEILKDVALAHPQCTVALEYMIPRMGKRVDAVILTDNRIFIVEFKINASNYPDQAIDQVADYAFDLKNFHLESHVRHLFPILVSSEAPSRADDVSELHDGIFHVQRANSETLVSVIDRTIRATDVQGEPLNHATWLASPYAPTPTIVEAARALYESNEVDEISRQEAGLTNIKETTACIDRIISESRSTRRKAICFVTGVPGAGKTLVGLNVASQRRATEAGDPEETAVFLSGNGPLIEVLQESLYRDQRERDREACSQCSIKRSSKNCSDCKHWVTSRRKTAEIKSEVSTFVQGVHLFREELFLNDNPPAEHIAIFDEAQRAWTREHLKRKMKTRWSNKRLVDKSEPECLIEYMDRHPDWAVMVCLVGGGQEINSGEAGIIEWFRALHDHFPTWDIFAPPEIVRQAYLDIEDASAFSPRIRYEDRLHLSVDMRSFRNKNVAAFVEAIVENRPDEARALYHIISKDYPVVMTRDLPTAKQWASEQTVRPSDRYGIIADSFGERIRADGITVPVDFDAATWFLNGREDVNSSYYMEIAASEFKIQGLEIDYAVVVWEADYRYENGRFTYHRFRKNRWQNVNHEMNQRYLKNGYRVLLTRARQGFIIYVPKGSPKDATRPPRFYDGTFEYLRSCGIPETPVTSIPDSYAMDEDPIKQDNGS